jgi:hypothetical protein
VSHERSIQASRLYQGRLSLLDEALDLLTDAKLTDQVKIVRCAVGTPTMDAVREKLSSATGKAPKFPTVEVEPGQFRTESDQLINHFLEKYRISTRESVGLDRDGNREIELNRRRALSNLPRCVDPIPARQKECPR